MSKVLRLVDFGRVYAGCPIRFRKGKLTCGQWETVLSPMGCAELSDAIRRVAMTTRAFGTATTAPLQACSFSLSGNMGTVTISGWDLDEVQLDYDDAVELATKMTAWSERNKS